MGADIGLICSIAGCERPEAFRDLCKIHARRWSRYGDPFRGRVIGDDEKRFWSHVDRRAPDECWPWLAARSALGYGIMRVRGRNVPAARFSLELAGTPVPKGSESCHHCDNPPCVNPAHLFVGSHQDNMDDRTAKGKSNPGERNGMAKLTEAQVRAILTTHPRGPVERQRIADINGVTAHTIYLIVTGRSWRSLSSLKVRQTTLPWAS